MLTVAELSKNLGGGRVMPPEAWGHPGWLSPSEILALETLRARAAADLFPTPETMMDDRGLLRFLRARKFSEAEAYKMLSADLEWRRVFEHRVIKASETAAVLEFCRNGMLHRAGFDKDGRPVIILRFRYAFPRQIKDMNEIVLFWVAYVQMLTDETERCGMTDFSVICDLDAFSPSVNFSMAMVKVLINILQNHYPERLGYLLLLNLPTAFRMGWSMLQPFLDERTKAKIHVLGKDIAALKEYIPASELQTEHGGTHAAYPKLDAYTTELLDRGIKVHTGFFVSAPSPRANNNTTTGLDRIRSMMVGGLSPRAVSSASKTNEVPKAHPRVTVFGANGRTGLLVITRFLERTDYDVVGFIRLHGGSGVPPALLKLASEYKDRLSLVVGDCMNFNDLDRAIEMSDAVVSCLGGSASAAQSSGGEYFESTARAIVDSMQRNGTRRLVAVTAAQAKRMSMAWWVANATLAENSTRHLYWGAHFKHVAEMEKFIQHEHDIDYTLLRPSQLSDESGETTRYVLEEDDFFIASGQALARLALARCIVDECVLSNKYLNKGVAIAGD